MARKLQSQKNQTARDNFAEDSGDRIRKIIEATNKKVVENRVNRAQAQGGKRSAGNDVYIGSDRSAPDAIVPAKKSNYRKNDDGSQTWLGPQFKDVGAGEALAISAPKDAPLPGSDASNQQAKDDTKQYFNDALDLTAKNGASQPIAAFFAPALKALNNGPLGDLVQDAAQDTGKEQAVKNPTQWLLNAASLGTYATARLGDALGDTAAKYQPVQAEQFGSGDIAGGIGTGLQSAGESIVNGFGGLARGVAEGFGARFDGEKPRTWGQNLEDMGSRDVIEKLAVAGARATGNVEGTDEAIAGLPGVEGGVSTTQGVVGTVGDIALDPLTYVTLGAGAGIKGAATAARAASKAAREGGVAARLAAGAKALPGGFARGAAARAAEDIGRRAVVAENRALRRANPAAPAELLDETAAVADEVAPVASRTATPDEPVDPPALAQGTPEAPARTPERLQQAEAVQGILNRTLQSTAAPVPARQILQQANGSALTRVDDQIQSAIQDAVVNPPSIAESRQAFRDLRATPEGAAVLDRPVTWNGQQLTVEKLAQMARASAAMDAPSASAMLRTLNEAMNGGAAGFDGAAFRQALADAGVTLRTRGRDAVPLSEMDDLISRLQDAPTERSQIAILRRAVENRDVAPTSSVGSFIDRAVDGGIDESTMKEMLTALGVRYQGVRSPGRLQELLDTRGRTEWAKIQDSLMTPEEVVARHALPADIVDDAADFDVVADEGAAAITATRMGDELIRLDDEFIGTPDSGSVADAVRAAAGALGAEVAKKAQLGDVSEFFHYGSKGAMTEVNRSVTQAISKASFTMSGAERAAFAGPRYLAATRLMEAEVRTLGAVVRVSGFDGTGEPLYANIGELAGAMGDDVFSELMFSPNYLRPTFKQERADQFRDGFTLYPNHLLEAAQFSRRPDIRALEPADRVAAVTEKLRTESKVNKFASTPEGDKAVQRAGEVIAGDEFAAKIDVIQGRNQVRAAAFANETADTVVAPLAMRLVDAIGRGLDRGQVMRIVAETSRDTTQATRNVAGAEDTLVRDLVKQRMDAGVVEGILGQAGTMQVRADRRVAVAAGQGSGRTTAPPAGSAGDLEHKAAVGGAYRDNLDDADEELILDVDAVMSDGRPVDESEIAVQMDALVNARTQMTAFGRGFDRAAVALHGPYGMGLEARTIAQRGRNEVSSATAEFTQKIAHWQHKLRTAIPAARGGDGNLSYPEVAGVVGGWWTKLANIDPAATSDEVLLALTRGADGVAPVPAAEAELITQFNGVLQEVFADGPSGLFARSGATAADVHTGQLLYGIVGPRAPFQVDKNIPLHAQTNIWRQVAATGFPADIDPLKLVADFHGAVGHAMVRPRIAGITAKTMDHRAAGFTSRQAAFDAGYRSLKPNPQRPTSLANYMPRDSMFDAATIERLTYLDAFANASATFKNAQVRAVANAYSQVNYAMKALATVWKPGHHVVSILGGMGANLIAGVGPEQVIRGARVALAALKEAGDDSVDAAISALGRNTEVVGQVPTAGRTGLDLLATDVRVVINSGGKKTPVQLTAGQLKTYAERYGAWISERTEREVLDLTGKPTSRVVAALGAPNRFVGKLSATRDNIIRMPLLIRVLESGQYSSLEEAFVKATARVNEIHPTWNTLSNAETKVISKLFFFYTWPKQMASLILREMLDRPGVISMPSKFQYELAEANGLDPESIGDPWSEENHRDLPTYYTNSPVGPMVQSGMQLGEQGDTPWSFNLQAPQIDALTFYFQGFEPSYGEPGYTQPVNTLRNGLGDATLGNLNPLLKAPYELTTLNHIENADRPVGNPSTQTTQERQLDWITGNLGALNAGSKALGTSTSSATYGLDPAVPEDAAKLDELKRSQQQAAMLNFWTGGRFTNLGLPGPLRSGSYQNQEITEKLGK